MQIRSDERFDFAQLSHVTPLAPGYMGNMPAPDRSATLIGLFKPHLHDERMKLESRLHAEEFLQQIALATTGPRVFSTAYQARNDTTRVRLRCGRGFWNPRPAHPVCN